MYQNRANSTCVLVELVDENEGKMSLGKKWVLPGKEKHDFGFAFINSSHVFLGSKHSRSVIDFDFDLDKNEWCGTPNVHLPGDANYISAVAYDSELMTLILVNRTKNYFLCFKPSS